MKRTLSIRSTYLGTFTYGGLEFHLPTFVQCMKDKGYSLSSAGRNELTNFGQR